MTTQSTSTIVVGVDGSPQSAAALSFALAEARRCGDTVHVVTSWDLTPYAVGLPLVPVPPLPPDAGELERAAQQVQDDALAAAGPVGVPLVRHVVEGEAGAVLVDAARDARLLVVGTRGLGGLRAALLGSVSRYCARHAECPVVVVPGPHAPTPKGVDEHRRRPADAGSTVLTPLY
jgi:nucleotide-binding universal stress UspA family protein